LLLLFLFLLLVKTLTMTRSWFVPDTGMGDRVFIRDEQFAWLPGTVIQTDFDGDNTGGPRAQVSIDIPDDWKLTTTRGQGDVAVKRKRWVSLKDYPKHQLPLQNQGVARDMAELPNLHEAAILYQVKARHGLQKPYTRVSEIVIAVNPCEWIPDLYSKEQQRMYAENVVWKGNCEFDRRAV
jgi:myosin-5